MACRDDSGVVDVEVAEMVENVNISQIPITAAFVLACDIVADDMTVFDPSFVEYFSIDMKEAPIFKRKMRNRIAAVSNSGFEVRSASVLFIEPHCEFGISDPG